MLVHIPKNDLALAISRVQGAVAEKNLGHIGLKAVQKKLRIMAADKVLAIYCDLDCNVEQQGTVFIPAKFFADVVKELPQGAVCLQSDDSWLTVTAGQKGEFTIKLPLKEDLNWMEAPKFASSSNVALSPSNKISYMIEQVQFCVAQESARSYGAVGYLHRIGEGTVRLVGTDGFRLSYCDVSFPMPKGFLPEGVSISKRALNELLRMCHEGFEEIKLSISDDQTTLCAEVEGYRIFILLSAVKYPNYQGVVPKEQPARLEVSRPMLQSVAKRVLLAAGKTKALQMHFSTEALTLSSKNLGSSEGREKIELANYQGPECSLAINGKYLSDVFVTTSSDELQIQFKNHEDPVVLVPAKEPKDCLSRHILVPIRESE
ncbi:MAG: DNA polymerase III subunit beta [Oligoflexales bacterium]|nr:DNA polymerase III subunit beta [Oligoflexales bacterium]